MRCARREDHAYGAASRRQRSDRGCRSFAATVQRPIKTNSQLTTSTSIKPSCLTRRNRYRSKTACSIASSSTRRVPAQARCAAIPKSAGASPKTTSTTLATQQKLFLTHAARVLKPGGRLVYSTCSVERDENEAVVHHFLQNIPGFELLETARTWPHREGQTAFLSPASGLRPNNSGC